MTASKAPAARELIVDVLVQPRASRVRVGPAPGASGDCLRVAVTAPPVDGKANAAVIAALAEAFAVRRADIRILRGETGRRKTVAISGGARDVLQRLLRGG